MSDEHEQPWLRLVRYAASGLLLGGVLGFVGALVLPRPRRGADGYRAPVPPRAPVDGSDQRRRDAGQDVVLAGDPAEPGAAPARRDPLVERVVEQR